MSEIQERLQLLAKENDFARAIAKVTDIKSLLKANIDDIVHRPLSKSLKLYGFSSSDKLDIFVEETYRAVVIESIEVYKKANPNTKETLVSNFDRDDVYDFLEDLIDCAATDHLNDFLLKNVISGPFDIWGVRSAPGRNLLLSYYGDYRIIEWERMAKVTAKKVSA